MPAPTQIAATKVEVYASKVKTLLGIMPVALVEIFSKSELAFSLLAMPARNISAIYADCAWRAASREVNLLAQALDALTLGLEVTRLVCASSGDTPSYITVALSLSLSLAPGASSPTPDSAWRRSQTRPTLRATRWRLA